MCKLDGFVTVLPCGCQYSTGSCFCVEGKRLYEEAYWAYYTHEHSVLKSSRSAEEEARLTQDHRSKRDAFYQHMGWK